MKPTGVTKFVVVALAAILLLGVSRTQAQTPANVAPSPTPLPISKDQRETIETVIREYLLKNPSIVREAMQALQAQEEKEKQERAANSLKSLEKDIYSDLDSPTVGNPKGDVSIVVFFDYHCGYCKQSLPALRELLTRDSSIRIVYKEFPILGPESQVAARAAEHSQPPAPSERWRRFRGRRPFLIPGVSSLAAHSNCMPRQMASVRRPSRRRSTSAATRSFDRRNCMAAPNDPTPSMARSCAGPRRARRHSITAGWRACCCAIIRPRSSISGTPSLRTRRRPCTS